MPELKCDKCLRNGSGENACQLKSHVELTLPWINEAIDNFKGVDKWDRRSTIGKILRGDYNAAPGFIEDWKQGYAILEEGVIKLIEDLSERNAPVELGFICNRCRYYSGP